MTIDERGGGESSQRAANATRPLLFIAGGLIGVLVIAAVIMLLANRPQPAFPADTPEGTFQRYLAAFDDGDYQTSYAYLSTSAQDAVPYSRYERAARDYSTWNSGRQRLTLDNVRVTGERATIYLVVREGGGPFDGGWEDSVSIGLVRQQGEWRIDQPLLRIYPIDRYEWDYGEGG